ncbi:hypothetical protein N7492_004837 [Penicillium capsulatum]|uniref:Alpha/beta hydrolase fold-3 domain-containing protein n=1 Tax=Penicillium capsulatum TaxID=69766 RepID=A0A9W9I8D6_9EURO|nr:hypothetical protein N7492_004837 [Penicillium capsulatum]
MDDLPPLRKVRLSLLHRLNCFLQLWTFKFLATVYFFVRGFTSTTPPATRPTLVKFYPGQPNLECRLFFPPNYESGQKLPVYLNIHGGGFAVCDATIDDPFCSSWAVRTGMLVISLSYRKAPRYPFPCATHDVASLARAILGDPGLPIDLDRVTIGGSSAGGNLALSAAQLPGLKGIVKAAISYYPIVDFGHNPTYKLDARPYRNGAKDNLGKASWCLDWGYVSAGQNRRDPLLSPCYARKEDLPPRIYLVAAQWDMLRLEAQEMIHCLAGLWDKVDQEEAFEQGNYKWTLAMGCSHGFTINTGRGSGQSSHAQAKSEEIFTEAHEWLKKHELA